MSCYWRPSPPRYLGMDAAESPEGEPFLRVGQAADILGVTVETLRRWEAEGRLTMTRSGGGQRLVALADITPPPAERRPGGSERPTGGGSAPHRLPGICTRIQTDPVAAVVEFPAGPP